MRRTMTFLTGTVAAIAIAVSLGMAPAPALAQLAIVPKCATTSGTPQNPRAPSLQCALQTFGNIAQFLLGITGSFALIMFVYGGFVFVTAAGNESRVTEGKTILTNALIGIVIIFFSGAVIRYGLSSLVKGGDLVVGQPCQGGGIVVQKPSGEIACVTGCSGVSDPDKPYDCVATATANAEKNSCVGSGPPLCKSTTESCCTGVH